LKMVGATRSSGSAGSRTRNVTAGEVEEYLSSLMSK
jgi:hypothetical protein